MTQKYPKQISLYISEETYAWLLTFEAKSISAAARHVIECSKKQEEKAAALIAAATDRRKDETSR